LNLLRSVYEARGLNQREQRKGRKVGLSEGKKKTSKNKRRTAVLMHVAFFPSYLSFKTLYI